MNRLTRIAELRSAYAKLKLLRERERWPRERIAALQRDRLGELVEHATRHAPFYRERYGGPLDRREVRLEELPTVSKGELMEDFDRAVTDPRLRRDELERHLATVREDELRDGEFRVMASSGSSGRRGLFVFDREGWSWVMAGLLRQTALVGLEPRLPRRRVAAIGAPDGKHMTYRMGASLDVGVHRTLRLRATQPLDELVDALNRFRPDYVYAYPSVAAQLASEQLAGRLRIAPGAVSTSSELRTEEMTERIRAAWGLRPHDVLGLTETGVLAVDCRHHDGLHMFEDLSLVEVEDDRVLVTNLFNRIQPLIRLEVSDLLTVSDEPCACGRTLRRVTSIDGRSDDVLELPRLSGGSVSVHPIHLRGPLAKLPGLAQYQVVHAPPELRVRIVGGEPAAVERALRDALARVGANPPLVVEPVDRIEREPGAGKLKLVKVADEAQLRPA